MRSSAFYFLLFLSSAELCSQSLDNDLLQIQEKKRMTGYIIVDNDTTWSLNSISVRRSKEKLVFHNNSVLDSSGIYLYDFRLSRKSIVGKSIYNKLYLVNEKGLTSLDMKLNDNEQIQSDFDRHHVISETRLRDVDHITTNSPFLFDVAKFICRKPPCYGIDDIESIDHVTQIASSKYFVETCIPSENGPHCDKRNYLIVDVSDQSVTPITNKFQERLSKSCRNYFRVTVCSKAIDGKYFKVNVNKSADFCTDNIQQSWVLDQTGSFVRNVLMFGESDQWRLYAPIVSGHNYQNGRLKYHYLSIELDGGKLVLVPYKFIPALDICMYKAYHDEVLSQEDISSLGTYELTILKNFFLAKHNYKFPDEFYEGYFNLYAFYNSDAKRTSRQPQEKITMTSTDAQNLKIIESKIK